MITHKFIIGTIVLGLMFVCGCGSNIAKKQPLYNPNFVTTLLNKDVMPEEPARHARDTMEPAIKIMQEFHKEVDDLGKLNTADLQGAEKLKQATDIAKKYIGRINGLKKEMLPWEDAIIPHVQYIRQINDYVNYSALEISKTSDLLAGKETDTVQKLRDIEHCRFRQEIAIIGYEHYMLVLTKGKNSYRLDKNIVKPLKKGMTYFDVVKILKMPGQVQRTGEVIWVHNDVVLFATFKYGKLDFWKINGAY